eukprot:superscaffoldBa00005321_g20192
MAASVREKQTAINRGDIQDTDMEAIMDTIVDSLFCFFVTLGAVPIIRCPRGNAAEMVAVKLDKKLRENLRDARNSLFTGDNMAAGQFSFQRPLFVLADRNVDMATPLHHTWTYQALIHDVLIHNPKTLIWFLLRGGGPDGRVGARWLHTLRLSAINMSKHSGRHPAGDQIPALNLPLSSRSTVPAATADFHLNRVLMEEGAGADPSPAGARPKKKTRKSYDLTAADKFWQKHKGSPFPEVAESVQEELDTYRAQEDEVKRLKSIMGLEGEDEGAISMLSDNTAKLTSAVSSLPELLEKKRLIDLHTNVATAVLDHIKSRKLDVYFEYEEKLMSKSTLDKSLLDIISDPDGWRGSRHVYLVMKNGPTADPQTLTKDSQITGLKEDVQSDLEQYKTALMDAGCDLSPLNYIKQWKLFSRVMNTGSQFVMEGVKNLVLKQHVS